MPNMHEWTTGISKLVSDGEDEALIIYGHRLTKLIGFADSRALHGRRAQILRAYP